MKKIFQKIIVKNLIAEVLSDIPGKHAIWLGAINSQDDLIALESATRGLEFALADKALPVKILSKIIDDAAQKTKPILVKVDQQFIRFEFMNSNLESNMLAVVYGFHKQLYSSYITLLNYFSSKPNQHTKNTIHLYMQGALEQAFEMLKWRSFVNLSLAPNIWLQIHTILEVARKNKLLNQPLSASEDYAIGTPSAVTLSGLLVQIYMLDSLQQANLSRLGIDLAAKLLKNQLLDVKISTEFNPVDFLFYVNLEKDFGAKRIRHLHPSNSLTNTYMYWQIDALETTIQKIIRELSHESSEIKSETLLNANFAIEPHQIKAAREAFSAILREWSRNNYVRQRRKETRRKVTIIANVLQGIEGISARIKSQENNKFNPNIKFSQPTKSSADDRLFDERLRSNIAKNHHHWVIVDESNRGLGAIASKELSNWIKVGKLIGLVLANSKQEMIIAVIKSIRPKENHQLQVGMEILSHHAKWIQLRPEYRPADNEETDECESPEPDDLYPSDSLSFTGLYLPIEAGLSARSTLILPRIEFVAHTEYEISIAGMLDRITLSESTDSKDDWIKIIYPR
ncbi:MAG TPA: hypothetical protein VES38_12385 [Methylotenera sp.]|nr:hypothetical protein [Methylotenera sp.]